MMYGRGRRGAREGGQRVFSGRGFPFGGVGLVGSGEWALFLVQCCVLADAPLSSFCSSNEEKSGDRV